jgi:hypothetical protein
LGVSVKPEFRGWKELAQSLSNVAGKTTHVFQLKNLKVGTGKRPAPVPVKKRGGEWLCHTSFATNSVITGKTIRKEGV